MLGGGHGQLRPRRPQVGSCSGTHGGGNSPHRRAAEQVPQVCAALPERAHGLSVTAANLAQPCTARPGAGPAPPPLASLQRPRPLLCMLPLLCTLRSAAHAVLLLLGCRSYCVCKSCKSSYSHGNPHHLHGLVTPTVSLCKSAYMVVSWPTRAGMPGVGPTAGRHVGSHACNWPQRGLGVARGREGTQGRSGLGLLYRHTRRSAGLAL